MNELKKAHRRLINASSKYKDSLGQMERLIQDHCDFEIYINEFPDDGICVMTSDDDILDGRVSGGMSLGSCVGIILDGDRITKDNFIVIY